MRAGERYEEVMAVLEELREFNKVMPVIVEGPADRRTLIALGLRGEVLPLNDGSSVFNFCEALARRYREVIILTDWDRHGGYLCRILREGLAANDVRYDDDIRARLTMLCRKDIKDVQGLVGHLARLQASEGPLAQMAKGLRVRAHRASRMAAGRHGAGKGRGPRLGGHRP